MKQYQYQDLTIEVHDESTYKYGSADNNFNYLKHQFGDGGNDYPTSKHGIKLFRDSEIIDSCIIIGSGGATGVHQNSSLLDNDKLIICCCNTIFCITLPDLELKWKTQADQATCFQLFKLQNDYLVHGEMQITRLDKDGEIKWQFGGADIFVSIEGKEEFQLTEDYIMLTDFSKTEYKLDFDGKLIWDTYNRTKKTAGSSTLSKTFRKWLQKLTGN